MDRLGYTFYPKDFISDPEVMMMTPSERGIYRDLIDLAYMSDNKIKYSIDKIAKYCNASVDEVDQILKIKGEKKDGFWRIPSCDKRIAKAQVNRENGLKGGRPKKPKKNPNNNPDNNPTETQTKRQRERERESERESEEELKEIVYREFKHLSLSEFDFRRLNKIYDKSDIDYILDAIENFKGNKNYTSLYLTTLNWLKRDKKIKNKTDYERPAL